VIGSSFHQFFTKTDFFKIGSAIVTLLQNRELIPHPTQRVVCIYLLYEMYRSDTVAANPFAPLFIHLLVISHFLKSIDLAKTPFILRTLRSVKMATAKSTTGFYRE
jgi:hypothetical protein